MSASSIVSHASVSSEEINTLVEHLQLMMEGVPMGHQIIALIATTLLIQNPNLTAEQIQKGVYDVSHFACLYLEGLVPEGVELTEDEKRLLVN